METTELGLLIAIVFMFLCLLGVGCYVMSKEVDRLREDVDEIKRKTNRL